MRLSPPNHGIGWQAVTPGTVLLPLDGKFSPVTTCFLFLLLRPPLTWSPPCSTSPALLLLLFDRLLADGAAGFAFQGYNCFTPALRLLYACFTPALTLLYACFTPALHLLYTCFTPDSPSNVSTSFGAPALLHPHLLCRAQCSLGLGRRAARCPVTWF